MKSNFLEYYRENLAHIRGLASEFAAEFPKIAARLELSEFDCRDPYIERLLEGTAFLAARVEKKLDDGHPRLLESILSTVSPFSLFPNPSGAVLELQGNFSGEIPASGSLLKGGSTFDAAIPGINTPCRFSTIWDTRIHPLQIRDVEYLTRDIDQFPIDSRHAQSALRITLAHAGNQPLSTLNVESLLLYLNLPDADASELQRLLQVDLEHVYRKNGDRYEACDEVRFEIAALESEKQLFHTPVRQLHGLQTLQEFMIQPAFFNFVDIRNLDSVLHRTPDNTVELLITFKRRNLAFSANLKSNSFRLNCVPVLNLFPKHSDRCRIEDRSEYHIVPERTAMQEYEVFCVSRLEFYNQENEVLFHASNFYDDNESSAQNRDSRNFFTVHRRESLLSKSAVPRSSYRGTEVYVVFAGDDLEMRRDELDQFSADLWCTNRDLPLLIRPETILTPSGNSALIHSASFLVAPGRPEASLIRHGAENDWVKISHISFNLSSALWQPGNLPLETIRNLLRGYSLRTPEETERILEGLTSIRTEPSTFRFIRNGCVFFEEGWRIYLTLDEQAYAGIGFFYFAQVLRHLLESYTPLNSLLEIILMTEQNGQITVWKKKEN